MNPTHRNLIEDLREYAAEMLDRGLAPSAHLDLEDVRAPSLTALLTAVKHLCALVPVLVDELEESESPTRTTQRWSPLPYRARPSRHPADYQDSHRHGYVPTRWVRTVPVREPDTGALAWLMHLVMLQTELLGSVRDRMQKQIEEARIARQGRSKWAIADEAELSALEQRLDLAELRLRRAAGQVRRANGRPLRVRERLPSPYPRSPAWVRLRQMARELAEPGRAFPGQLRAMLSGPPETADLPYLYQRWCGVKLVETFRSLGWKLDADPVGPLLLGGRIRLVRERMLLDVWVEPRLTSDSHHPCGFRKEGRGEMTPDFLIVTKGPSRYDAFVLDATMTHNPDVMRKKDKYLMSLRASRPGYGAGHEVYYRPRRSWAAAPIRGGLSRIRYNTAEWGVIPMDPARFRPGPLRAWCLDIDRYARAWSSVEDDARFRPLPHR